MKSCCKKFNTSLLKKLFMAFTGIGLIGFVTMHLAGNLLIFGGPDLINSYAAGLKSQPTYSILWILRAGLLGFFVFHIYYGIKLTIENKHATAENYRIKKTQVASFSSVTMIYSGLFLLFFVLYHLSHFTFGLVDSELLQLIDSQGRHDVYSMLLAGFSNFWVSIFYIAAMFFLWLHVGHGGSSIWQSLGLNNKRLNKLIRFVGPGLATFLLVGNCSIVLAVFLGWIR